MSGMRHVISTDSFSVEGDGIVMENGVATVYNRDMQGTLVPIFRMSMPVAGTWGWFGVSQMGAGLVAQPTQAAVHQSAQVAQQQYQQPAQGPLSPVMTVAPAAPIPAPVDPAQMAQSGLADPVDQPSPNPILDPGRPDPVREIGALQRHIQRGDEGGVSFGHTIQR